VLELQFVILEPDFFAALVMADSIPKPAGNGSQPATRLRVNTPAKHFLMCLFSFFDSVMFLSLTLAIIHLPARAKQPALSRKPYLASWQSNLETTQP